MNDYRESIKKPKSLLGFEVKFEKPSDTARGSEGAHF
jgi:hypothetical protein